jgi:acyl carrier protein
MPRPSAENLLEKKVVKAPATEIEEKLLTMVRRILNNDAVQVKDNFFLAGGHSLLGMQLVMQLRDAFGVDLTLRQFFATPTVQRLALSVEKMIIDTINAMSDEEAELQLT